MGIQGSGYIEDAFDNDYVKKIVKSFGDILKKDIFGDFDGIACTGTSGLIVAPLLAYTYNKKLLVVRKQTENSHSKRILEGYDDINKYIIVDDFVSSGRTLFRIVSDIELNSKANIPTHIGCFLWHCSFFGCNEKEKLYPGEIYNKVAKNKMFVKMYNKSPGYDIDVFDDKKYEKENS